MGRQHNADVCWWIPMLGVKSNWRNRAVALSFVYRDMHSSFLAPCESKNICSKACIYSGKNPQTLRHWTVLFSTPNLDNFWLIQWITSVQFIASVWETYRNGTKTEMKGRLGIIEKKFKIKQLSPAQVLISDLHIQRRKKVLLNTYDKYTLYLTHEFICSSTLFKDNCDTTFP